MYIWSYSSAYYDEPVNLQSVLLKWTFSCGLETGCMIFSPTSECWTSSWFGENIIVWNIFDVVWNICMVDWYFSCIFHLHLGRICRTRIFCMVVNGVVMYIRLSRLILAWTRKRARDNFTLSCCGFHVWHVNLRLLLPMLSNVQLTLLPHDDKRALMLFCFWRLFRLVLGLMPTMLYKSIGFHS